MPTLATSGAATLLLAFLQIINGCSSEPRPLPVGRAAAVDSYVKAVLVYRRGDTDAAISALKDAVAQHEDLTMAHSMLGDLYHTKRNYVSALEQYEISARLDPYGYEQFYHQGLMYQLMNRTQDAIAAYLRALQLNPKDFSSNLNLAAAYLALNKPVDAKPYAKKATELDEFSAAAWSNYGVALDQTKEYAAAEPAFRRSLELDTRSEVSIALADNLIHQKKLPEARSVMNQTVLLENSAYTHKRLGDVMFLQQQYEPAIQEYNRALQLDKAYYPALNEIGWLSITQYTQSLGLDDTKRLAALTAWKQSLAIDARQPRINQLMAAYNQKYSDER